MQVLMCAPRYFAIRYEINPWMKMSRPILTATARQQWNGLVGVLRGLGVSVLEIPQKADLPDMVFTANAGVVQGRMFIPSHFRHSERQGETHAFTSFFKKRGYKIADIARGLYFEGEGDLLAYRDMLFGGFRYRSEVRAHEKVCVALKKRLIGLELTSPHFYHLDTCFFPLDEATVLFYPGAFDVYGRKAIESFVANPVPVGKPDARAFACNALRVGKTVVMNTVSSSLKKKLGGLGYHVVETPTSEFVKAGGSVKCLLLKL